MLKSSHYFTIKEAWEGLRRADDTGIVVIVQDWALLKYLVKYYQNGFHESPIYLTTTALIPNFCSGRSTSSASNILNKVS